MGQPGGRHARPPGARLIAFVQFLLYTDFVARLPDRLEKRMETSTLSQKYQVVIPLRVRRMLGLKPGQKMQVIPYQGRIELVPLETVRGMRGFLKGIDTAVEREEDRP
jgi:AbrB family looped-hinge helix DNA binding protein